MFDPCTGSSLDGLLDRSRAPAESPAPDRPSLERAVRELVAALRTHHRGTAEHSNRLAADCRRVGEELALESEAVLELELVAMLHDIGKLAIPARVLDLPRRLTPRERALVRGHTVRGAEILAEVAELEHVAPLVRASHERWDGKGYPDRLAGADIPLPARIVCTVDAYDAMTNDRPYRRALARAEARRRIGAAAGSAFEPRIVRAVLKAL